MKFGNKIKKIILKMFKELKKNAVLTERAVQNMRSFSAQVSKLAFYAQSTTECGRLYQGDFSANTFLK